MNSTYMKL